MNTITIEYLKRVAVCKVTGYGQSMTPILKSGQSVICEPVTEDIVLNKNDTVLYKMSALRKRCIWA